MDAKLNHSDFSALLSKQCNISANKADIFTKAFFDTLLEGLEADGIVKINGLGTFKMVDVASRGSVNVNTGEKIEIKGHRKLTFLPADSLKENVNQPFAMFEPVEVDDDYTDDDVEEGAIAEEPAITSEQQTTAAAVEEGAIAEEPATTSEQQTTAAAVEEEKAEEPATTSEQQTTATVEEEKAEEPAITSEQQTTATAKKPQNIIIYTLFIIIAIAAIIFFHFSNSNENKQIEETETTQIITPKECPKQAIQKPDTLIEQPTEEIKEFILVEEMENLPLSKITIKDTTIYRTAGTTTIHRVGLDETLTKISLKYFKDKRLWPYIVHYNNIKEYNKLEIGTELKIPHLVPRK